MTELHGKPKKEKQALQRELRGSLAARSKSIVPDLNLANIVEGFNIPPTDNAQATRDRRIQRLIELFQEATRLSEQIRHHFDSHDKERRAAQYQPGPDYSTGFTFSVDWLEALNKRFNQVSRELFSITSRYRSHSVVRFSPFTVAPLVVGEHWITRNDDERTEHAVIAQLLKNDGRWIYRCRRCLHCGRWFFARTEHQMHCSEKCRKARAAIAPEFKKKRADYMRDTYRPAEKKRAIDALQLARKREKR
jgi:hypothetical protein